MSMWGYVVQQAFHALVGLIVGGIAAYGARRFRSSGLMTLAFTHLLHAVSATVFALMLWQPLFGRGGAGFSSISAVLSLLSIGSTLFNAVLSVAAVVLFLRDFARWQKRSEEAEAHINRLAQERMEREREGSSFPIAAAVGER